MNDVFLLLFASAGGFALAWVLRNALTRRRRRQSLAGRDSSRLMLDRYRTAIETTGFSLWEVDVGTDEFVWVENRITVDGIDRLPAAEYGEALRKLIHPQDHAEFRAQLTRAIAAGDTDCSYRYRLMRPDGLVRHLQSHVRIVRDAHGVALRLRGTTADITNEIQTNEMLQRQAEQERALLERFSMAAEAAGIVSWEVDMEMRRFVLADESLAQLLGIEDFTGSTDDVLKNMVPEDRGVFDEAVSSGNERFSCRYRVRCRSGLLHIQTHARLIFADNGMPLRMYGISWNINKEIEAAEQLQQQAQRLRDVERRLERASLSSSEGHWECDVVHQTLWMSSSYHALLGYADGELPTQVEAFDHYIHPEDLAITCALMERHFEEGTPFICNQRLRMKSGEYRWFRQRGMAERDAHGRPLSVAGSIQDIHEQKLAEDALQLAQQRFERAIAGTQDGLWELESSGAAWSSPRLGQLLGYSDDLDPSTNFLRDHLHPDDTAVVDSAAQLHLEENEPYDVEIRLRGRDSSYRWYRARARAERHVDDPGYRFSGSLQDVTEARSAREQLLRATEAAEAANRAKSEFLANVSHEIRTPMNGIIGMTGLLLDTALDRTQRDYADTIRGSADSLLTVINDILDFSKIEAGKLDIEALEMDVRSSVEDVGSVMAFQAAARNLELVVHVHPEIPERLVGDPQRLRQCLVNLVGNAIKFTSKGEIVIEVSKVGRRDGKTLLQFEVRDTGIGIAPETLATLFQPFVQADSSTTRHFGGTGLGLSIVRRLVEMMGGEVGVDSEPGKGSVFWFVLPMPEATANTLTVPVDLTRLGRRILVVDDQETNRRVIGGQLLHAGYETSLAGSGEEALRLMRRALNDGHSFDAVIVDYRMQDMDGAALGERINKDAELSQARVIVLTSLDRHGDIRRFASLGFAAYLTKPVRARELFECLDKVLARDAKEWHLQSQPIVTRGTLSGGEPRRFQGQVLLVEDNAVNQKVAVRFLERMGCKVRVADNGAEGVKAWAEGRFDIVLMDLQMPVMDGLTATRRIRELEHERAARPTPIVALTANAMSGQLERCLEAGMNDFLTKPLDIARLHAALDRHGLGAMPDSVAASSTTAVNANVPVELARLNELTAGDVAFAHELADTFAASGEQVLREMHSALDQTDRTALARAAHKLKGACANIYAEPLRCLAFELETNGPGLDQPRLRDLVLSIDLEFRRATQFLQAEVAGAAAKAG